MLQPDGLHIAALEKPSATAHPGPAYVFRVHLDGSTAGFVAWDRQAPIVSGALNTLRWSSGAAAGSGSSVAIERWIPESALAGRWAVVQGGETVSNGGLRSSFAWAAPAALAEACLLRVRVLGEKGLEHVAQMPLAA